MAILITDYLSLDSLKLKVDGLIINSSLFSTFNDKTFSLNQIKKIALEIKNNNYLLIINCDRIIPENEIEIFDSFINAIKKLPFDYIIYSDYAILNYFDKSEYHKLIYDSKTLVCSKEELSVIPTKSFISSEISFEEIKTFDESKGFAIDAFGYRQMMYSRRPLLSLVLPRNKAKCNTLYDLIEETRNDRYKIYEVKRNKYNYGTFIYNKGIYLLFNELKELNNIEIIRLNSMFLGDVINDVAREYYNLLHLDSYNDLKIKKILSEKLPNITIDNTFLDRESVLIKESK